MMTLKLAALAAVVSVGCNPGTSGKGSVMSGQPEGHYATIDSLRMYYETVGDSGRPLVLLHGAFSNIATDFGKMLPALARTHRVIGVELQGHGHTADIDRPLSYEQLADDVAELLDQITVDSADFLGYSMGGGVALQVAVRHPERVHKVVWFGGAAYDPAGFYPELIPMEKTMTPEMLAGSPWQQAYAKIAPHPADWAKLVEQVKTLDINWKGFAAKDLQAITAPVLIINGDADVVRPEHAVEMLRLLGGGVAGDLHPMPRSQLAILPGTTHVSIVEKTDWIVGMTQAFLEGGVSH
jgi:pimeloyl-ACP methyl ester carboxylesterase